MEILILKAGFSMKKVLFWVLMLLPFMGFSQVTNLYKIPLPSGYSSRIVGVAGSAADGETINGVVGADGLHWFSVDVGGQYLLYVDAAGGTNWTLAANWSNSPDGRTLWGGEDAENAILLSRNSTGGALGASGLQSNTINGGKVIDSTLTAADIDSRSLKGINIGLGEILAENLANLTVTGAKIANATVTGAKVANSTLTVDNMYAEGSYGTVFQSDGGNVVTEAPIQSAHIQDLTIATQDIAPLAVDSSKLDSGAAVLTINNIKGHLKFYAPVGPLTIQTIAPDTVKFITAPDTISLAFDPSRLSNMGAQGSLVAAQRDTFAHGNGNLIVFAFDDTTPEYIEATTVLGPGRPTGAAWVEIFYFSGSDNANRTAWRTRLRGLSPEEGVNSSPSGWYEGSQTISETLDNVNKISIAITNPVNALDGPGEVLRIDVGRYANNENDTAKNDVYVIAINFKYLIAY